MHSKIIDILKNNKPNITGVKRESSVLIPLINENGIWHVLYEVRSAQLKSQPNEICFPGGKMECHEHSKETAIRETCEELNLTPDEIEIVGQMDSIITSFDMLIHCYVGIISKPFEAIDYSKDEVDEIFMVPVSYLCANSPDEYEVKTLMDLPETFPYEKIPDGKRYNFRSSSYPVIFYDFKGKSIWGLTARMTQKFIGLISKDCGNFDEGSR